MSTWSSFLGSAVVLPSNRLLPYVARSLEIFDVMSVKLGWRAPTNNGAERTSVRRAQLQRSNRRDDMRITSKGRNRTVRQSLQRGMPHRRLLSSTGTL